ncbi:MAG: hypothetical protein WCD52_01895 [Xanthobacteraceae bacterium]
MENVESNVDAGVAAHRSACKLTGFCCFDGPSADAQSLAYSPVLFGN